MAAVSGSDVNGITPELQRMIEAAVSKTIDRDVTVGGGGVSAPEPEFGIEDNGSGFSDDPDRPVVFPMGTRVMLVTDVRLRLNKNEGLVLTVVKKPFMVLEHPEPTDDSRSWSFSQSSSDTVATLNRKVVITKSIYDPSSHVFRNERVKVLYLGDEESMNDETVFTAEPVCTGK